MQKNRFVNKNGKIEKRKAVKKRLWTGDEGGGGPKSMMTTPFFRLAFGLFLGGLEGSRVADGGEGEGGKEVVVIPHPSSSGGSG